MRSAPHRPVAVMCLLAATSCLAQPLEWVGSPGSFWGSSLTPVGDQDGDGRADVAVGAPLGLSGFGPTGRVIVRSWTQGPLNTISGEMVGDQFGAAVAALEDVNGDGIPELIVGAWGSSGTNGKVYVFAGGSGALLWSASGQNSERLGFSVASAGDTRGVGVSDVIVGAPGPAAGSGSAYVFAGDTGALLRTFSGSNPGDGFGYAVCRAGLVDSDGREDVAVSSPFADISSGSDAGRVTWLSPWSGSTLRSTLGTVAGMRLGFSLLPVGDLDSNGRREIAVGAPDYPVSGTPRGRVLLLDPGSSTPTALATWTGGQNGAAFGRSMAVVADVTGDGEPELAVGEPGFDGPLGLNEGRVLIVQTQGSAILGVVSSPSSSSEFGTAMAAAGDLNGDSVSDLVLAAPRFATSVPDSGLVQIYLAPRLSEYGSSVGGLNSMTLSAAGLPFPGLPLSVSLVGGTPGAQANIWIALGEGSLPLSFPSGTLTVLLDLSTIRPPFAVPLDANGAFQQVLSLPPVNLVPLVGAQIFAQAESTGFPGASPVASNGLRIALGR